MTISRIWGRCSRLSVKSTSWRKRDSNTGPSASRGGRLTTRPTRRLHYSCLHCTDLVYILPLVLVLWESTPLALVLHIGPVLITATPAVPVLATLEPVSLLARRFAFSASSAQLGKFSPKRNSFEVSFAFCWAVQMTR